jgi:hypothetical protein
MILFGGFKMDNNKEIYFNDSWILDFNKMEWRKAVFNLNTVFPHERNRHIAIYLTKFSTLDYEYILIHSGNYLDSLFKDIWLDDLFLLEINSKIEFKWNKLDFKVLEKLQASRSQHTAIYLDQNSDILLFGGEFYRERLNDVISIKLSKLK